MYRQVKYCNAQSHGGPMLLSVGHWTCSSQVVGLRIGLVPLCSGLEQATPVCLCD